MSFLERWNSVQYACFAKLSLARLNPESLPFEGKGHADTGTDNAAI